jgi:hypothetical protein
MSEAQPPVDASTERYAVSVLLGRGGMGVVYKAHDRHSGDTVALKRLASVSDERKRAQLTELFHQEFRTLAQLAHPHVVRAHDYGVDAGGPYYTMELLEGQALHELSPLPWRSVCALMRDVCSAVALLHSRRLLHRDLSTKNIQRTHDGRAKLIDFGAMTPMGHVVGIVGTPPLLPPEALLQQPLDGRADLYSLGATMFYALTGTHAYPARNFAQLRELWRSPPPPPSTRAPDVPAGLDALVMSLLSQDPSARPRSATEVIDRLSALAGLRHDEHLADSHAYLLTPELVGRAAELAQVRARIAELLTGRGGALAIEGAPGMGRSRMLDTAVLEAKLAGVGVARASAADSSDGAYGVIGALVRQLMELLPHAVRAPFAAMESLSLLSQGGVSAELDAQRRADLQGALIVLLRAVARVQPIAIAIDDLDRCDEPSQAALASAMQASRRERVLIALTCALDRDRDAGAVALLREGAASIALSPFAPEDTEALLSSVFGDVPHLPSLASRVHARAEGSPRGCMELAEHLKEQGLVRYRAGSWELPAQIAEDDLPSSLSNARRMRLSALSPDARELAEALAVAEAAGLDFGAYAELTAHGDLDRVRLALDELLLSQVLRCEGVHYSFEAQAWPVELRDGLDPAAERAICARIAGALERRNSDRLDVARYLWRAGDEARTIDVLLAELKQGSRWDRCAEDYAQIVQGAAQACLALGRPRADRLRLLHELMRCGQDLALPGMREHLGELFAQLRRDSSLDDWTALDPALDPLSRLQQAFEIAQKRHDAAPPADRGLPPIEAINALVRLVIDTVAVGAQTGDYAITKLPPPLHAFFPISPAISRIEEYTRPACQSVIAGRYEHARELYVRSLAMLGEIGELPGVDAAMHQWSINAVRYALGCIDGGMGSAEALRYAAELERSPRWMVPAVSVRRIYHLMLGNHQKAERCRKQVELLLLQSPIKPSLSAGAVHQHLFTFSMADDLTGMSRSIPEMEALSRTHPTMFPFVMFARAEQARICGDFEAALAQLDRFSVEPGEHPLWPCLAGARLRSLLALGRVHEAHALGLREYERAEAVGLQIMKDYIILPLALCEAELGDYATAQKRVDEMIAGRLAANVQGVALGWAYEARARIAAFMHDTAGFEHYAQLCAQQFRKSEGDPALAAKYERLMLEARTRGLTLHTDVADALAAQTTFARTSSILFSPEAGAALAALSACTSAPDRAQHALTLLMTSAGAQHGELYLKAPSGVWPAASSRAGLSDEGMRTTFAHMIERAQQDGEGEDEEEHTSTLSFHVPAQDDLQPRLVWPLLLTSQREGNSVVVGVAALHFAAEQSVRMPFEIAAAIADILIQAGDADASVHSLTRTEVLRPR